MQSAVLDPVPPTAGSNLLPALAERAQAELAAEGVAVALSRAGEIVCEASWGAAPDVGTALSSSSTLSAECMRTGEPVSHTTPPDDNGAGGYSVLLVPVLVGDKAIGLCVAFCARENAFTAAHTERLAEIARAVAESQQPSVPVLSPVALQQLEQAISDFAHEEKQRQRLRKAQKIAAMALATCVLAVSLIPDRVAAWVKPLLHRFERSHQAQTIDTSDRSRR